MGEEPWGAKSAVVNKTPFGALRGAFVVFGSGIGVVLETGTASDEWKVLKALPENPKGKKGSLCVSDPMTEVPSDLVEVVITRGAGSRRAVDTDVDAIVQWLVAALDKVLGRRWVIEGLFS